MSATSMQNIRTWENFHGRADNLQKLRKFSPSNVLLCMVCGYC